MEDEVKRHLARLFPDLERRYGGCEKKLAYATVAQAVAVKERREARAGIILHVYRCEYGDHWHLSSQAPTAAQQARLQEQFQMAWHGIEAELKACRQKEAALLRQAEDLIHAMQRRSGRVSRLRPSLGHLTQQLIQGYEAHRDDLVRLEDLFEQLRDVQCTFDQIHAWGDVALAYHGHLTPAAHQTWLEQCADAQAQAEAKREADAALIRGALERLDAEQAENLARARAYLNTKSRLPTFRPRD